MILWYLEVDTKLLVKITHKLSLFAHSVVSYVVLRRKRKRKEHSLKKRQSEPLA